MLTVGGRYVCGNANSPDAGLVGHGQPAGPAQLPPDRRPDRVPPGAERPDLRQVRDPSTNEPIIDPATGKVETFKGWRDPNYKPAPGATPYPGLLPQRADRRRRRRLGGARRLDRPERAGRRRVTAPSGAATTRLRPDDARRPRPTRPSRSKFDNQDATAPHNVVIQDADGSTVAMGDTTFFSGPKSRSTRSRRSRPGTYPFMCQVHPSTMTGTLDGQVATPATGGDGGRPDARTDGGRWRSRPCNRERRSRAAGPCSGCSTPTAGAGRRSRPPSGSSS